MSKKSIQIWLTPEQAWLTINCLALAKKVMDKRHIASLGPKVACEYTAKKIDDLIKLVGENK